MDLSVLGRDPGGINPSRWAASFRNPGRLGRTIFWTCARIPNDEMSLYRSVPFRGSAKLLERAAKGSPVDAGLLRLGGQF